MNTLLLFKRRGPTFTDGGTSGRLEDGRDVGRLTGSIIERILTTVILTMRIVNSSMHEKGKNWCTLGRRSAN